MQIPFFPQFAFGVIPNVRAKGVASTKSAELLNSMQQEDPVNMDDVMPTDKLFWLRSFSFADHLFLFGDLDGDSGDKHCYFVRQRGKIYFSFYMVLSALKTTVTLYFDFLFFLAFIWAFASMVLYVSKYQLITLHLGKITPLICYTFVMYLFFSIQVDLVTPMCSQLTYEGLLDEVD